MNPSASLPPPFAGVFFVTLFCYPSASHRRTLDYYRGRHIRLLEPNRVPIKLIAYPVKETP